jgi:arylsulfatase
MIANIDENMGRLEAFLKDSGLRENTILIFMTDNGTATGSTVFDAGMRGKKTSLYEGGHRVPFFLRWPAGQLLAAGDIDALTECQDVLPTLVDLCHLKRRRGQQFDGISLAKLLRAETKTLPDRMLVTQFSRMDQPQPGKNDAAVLWGKWRLVSGTELYDLSTDPGQQRNVFAGFPKVAARMQKHYEDWWKRIEPRVNEFSAIVVGERGEPDVRLTPCDWRDVFLDQQAQIRRQKKNGCWVLAVARPGQYVFYLRRWPREAELPIAAAAPEYRCVDGVYAAGHALPITSAEIQIARNKLSSPVRPTDQQAVFCVRLKSGPTELWTCFRDADGKEICGAYYVYVRGPIESYTP